MACLLSLSTELFMLIFEQLFDLDDPVSLARTCTALHNIYKRHKATVLWSIIVTTPSLTLMIQLLILDSGIPTITNMIPRFADCMMKCTGQNRTQRLKLQPRAFSRSPGCLGIILISSFNLPAKKTWIGISKIFLCGGSRQDGF